MYKIYFNNKVIIITNEEHTEQDHSNTMVFKEWKEEIYEYILENLESNRATIFLIKAKNIDDVLNSIKKRFTIIQAAGGAVINSESGVLLIFRRGKWDLPKGKLDEGESLEKCAVREVEEETGLSDVQLNSFLITTYHTYMEEGKSILKETHWYKMSIREKQELTPQLEEDILECRWVSIAELSSFEDNMQPSVRDVVLKIK
jgi:8-oxo-dGTP pyrophosphatase MutT (NUDIX family)